MKLKYPPRKSTGLAPGETHRPVVGLDIDGTLAQYHAHFTWFACHYFGRDLPLNYEGDVPFWRHLGLSRAKYREAKLHYRLSGLKRAMPPYAAARWATQVIRRTGAELVLCTTRPYLKVDGIEEDTREWLRRNGIKYDGLLLGERKYLELARRYSADRVVAVVDDEVELLRQADTVGLPGWLLHRDHNRARWSEWPVSSTVYDLGEVARMAEGEIRQWELKKKTWPNWSQR